MLHFSLSLAALVVAGTLVVPVFASNEAQVEHGIEVFADQRCSLCHSVADKGNKKGPLDGVGDRLSADDIMQWLINPAEMTAKTNAKRKPFMKVYSNLPEEDLEALVSYLLSLTSN